LAEKAGGYELCRDEQGESVAVFAGNEDPDYQVLLAMIAAGKAELGRLKRFDMAGFQPRPEYLREMRHYGVLPLDFPDDTAIDPYDLDRRYWASLWPVGAE
jgi:hypothetical protein